MAQRAVKLATSLPAKIPAYAQSLKRAGSDLIVAAKPVAERSWALAAKELGPPSPSQWPVIKKDLQGLVKDAQKMAFLNVSVGQAVGGLLVGVEVACWFFVGEIVGRGSLIGYNV